MIAVASYCRVSTDSADQANSFASQQRYFQEYVDRQPDWTLYRTYADEGVTGTSTKKRAAFNRMIADARQGKFQLILTKEVSRFSRNILDTVAYTRELRQLGVGVLFLSDGINTMDPDAELRLSIMGSIAQEESRKTSSRVKWGQTRQMERGVVFGRSLLGYDVKDGHITVNPEGAEVVRQIFHKYGVEKKGAAAIARELEEAGCRTCTGGVRWSGGQLVKILKNEKYAGDLVQKKTITPDYLTHERKYNHGEEALVVLRDHHEPIVARELWETVQSELKKRDRRGGGGGSSRYLFSGKIRCGECGASFTARKKLRKDGSSYRRWSCRNAAKGRCGVGRLLRDGLALEILKEVLASLQIDRTQLAAEAVCLALEAARAGEDPVVLERELSRLEQKREAALDAFFSGLITSEELRRQTERWATARQELEARLDKARREPEAAKQELERRVSAIVNGRGTGEAFYRTILERMTVFRDGRVVVELRSLPQRWEFQLEGRCVPD